MPPPAEHQTVGAPVLRAGAVGPAVDGRQTVAHIALVSPSGALAGANTAAQINAQIAALTPNFTNVFTPAGHQVTFDLAPGEPSPTHIAAAYRLAGTDAQRWRSLRWGLFDPATAAAIAIRGGHGATRLLDELAAHVAAELIVRQARRWPFIPPVQCSSRRSAWWASRTSPRCCWRCTASWGGPVFTGRCCPLPAMRSRGPG